MVSVIGLELHHRIIIILWGHIGISKIKEERIRMKVDMYEICLYSIIYCLMFYFRTILTKLFSRFVVSLSPGERISGCIGQKYLIQ